MKKKWKSNRPKSHGTVYVIEIWLEDKKLIKVGATSRPVKVRTCEILSEIESEYGYFPRTRVIKQRSCKGYYKVEAALHKRFKEYKYETLHEFSGSSEVFNVPMVELLKWYDYEINQDVPVQDKKIDDVCLVTTYNGL